MQTVLVIVVISGRRSALIASPYVLQQGDFAQSTRRIGVGTQEQVSVSKRSQVIFDARIILAPRPVAQIVAIESLLVIEPVRRHEAPGPDRVSVLHRPDRRTGAAVI